MISGTEALLIISGQHAHDVALLHDQEFVPIQLDFGSRPLAKQHSVADLELDRDQLSRFVTAARPDRGNLALRGLFLGSVRNDDAAFGLFFGIKTLDHDAVMQRTKCGFSHDGSFGGSYSDLICDQKWTGIRTIGTAKRKKQFVSLAIVLSK